VNGENRERGVFSLSVTRMFIERINKIRYHDFPERSIKMAKMAIMDNVGNALGALATEVGSIFVSLGQGSDNGCCTIWGTGRKTSAMEASLINASLAQVLDYDDTYEINSLAVSHPGPAVIAAALTVGEKASSSGQEVIKAVILGYEAAIRVAKAIEPRKDEFWGFANTQIMGAVTSAGILLKLNQEEMINAYGTAVSCSPVPNTNMMWSLQERPMSWIKDGVGFAASTGVMSAYMAKAGFYSSQRALDKADGYYLLCGSEDYQEEAITEGLGESFEIEKMSFKPYPTCRFMQSSLDSLSLLIRENDIENEQVEGIEVYLTPSLTEFFSVYEPPSMVDAQFSLPYAAAMMLEKIPPSPLWYTKERLHSSRILKTAQKIKLITDMEVERLRIEKSILSPRVRIVMKNGKVYEKQEYCAKGHPEKPFSEEDFKEKFINMLPDLKYDKKKEMIYKISQLENYRSIAGLFDMFELK
jgi:2-methylcitrate dehydratase PrpD